MSEETTTTEASDSQQTSAESPPAAPADWRSSLPETFKDTPFFNDSKSPEDYVNQVKHAAEAMGQSIRIPSKEASDADRVKFLQKVIDKAPELMLKPDFSNDEQSEEFWKMMGRPDDVEGYKYDPGEGGEIPENIKVFAEIAHRNGLNQQQFQNMVDSILDSESAVEEQVSQEQKDELVRLHAEWGLAYDTNLRALNNFLQMTDAPESMREMLKENELPPAEMKWLFGIATQTQSAVELARQPVLQSEVYGPAEAKNRITEILNNPQHPYHRGDKDAIKKMVELHQMANPDLARAG